MSSRLFKTRTSLSHHLPFALVGLVFIALFAVVGYIVLTESHAATNNADFNNDGTVNILDLSTMATNWSNSGMSPSQGDANGDGTVNILDLSILATQWGTNPNGGGGSSGNATFTVSDPRCTSQEIAAANSCTMTFSETSFVPSTLQNTGPNLDVNPLTSAAINDPRPGLVCEMLSSPAACLARNSSGDGNYHDGTSSGFTQVLDSDLASYTSAPMTTACSGSPPFHNCGAKMSWTSSDSGTYYFDNCLVNGKVNIAANSPVTLYFTNCHFIYTGDSSAGSAIGLGGHMHLLHDVFDGSAAGINDTHAVVVDSSGALDTTMAYNDFYQNTDQGTFDEPVNFQWNYFHMPTLRCSSAQGCTHTDGGPEMYWGNDNSQTHPMIDANNYFSTTAGDGSGGPANITTDFVGSAAAGKTDCSSGCNQWIYVAFNKQLPAGENNTNGLITRPQCDYSGCPPLDTPPILNITVINNTFYSTASEGPDSWNNSSGSGNTNAQMCGNNNRPAGQNCVLLQSGNTKMTSAGVSSSWP